MNNIHEIEMTIFECIDWADSVIEDMLEDYKSREAHTESERHRLDGAIMALEELSNIINGN